MLDDTEIKKILKRSIKNCLCIDDKFLEPYQEGNEDADDELPAQLREAFQKELNCTFDVYNYQNLGDFEARQETITTKCDCVVLDWELNENDQDKSKDTLDVLLSICRKNVRFVTIYTHKDTKEVAFQLYSKFRGFPEEKDKQVKQILEDKYSEIFEEIGIDIEDVEGKVENLVAGYNLNFAEQNRIKKECLGYFNQLLKDSGKVVKDLCLIIKENSKETSITNIDEFLSWYEISKGQTYNDEKTKNVLFELVLPEAFLINGTLVVVATKDTVKPEFLIDKLVDNIINAKNGNMIVLSILLKEVVDDKLSDFQQQFDTLDRQTLLKHSRDLLQSGADILTSFMVKMIGDYTVSSLLDAIEPNTLLSLMDDEGKDTDIPSEENIHKTNSFLTFYSKDKMKSPIRKIQPGDVFVMDKPIRVEGNIVKQYIICISQSCECLRPEEKILCNYSFAVGHETSIKYSLENAEEDLFTYLPNGISVKWTTQHFTINIKEYNLNMKAPVFKFLYAGETLEASFLGQQKELFTQRIINRVYSYAMRMGVDLPHKEKTKNNKS